MAKECEAKLQKIIDGFKKSRNAFMAIVDETRWKDIANLANLIYESIQHISKQS